MNVFLIGGTGFIGSYVVNELINCGHSVTMIARNPDKIEAFKNNSMIEIIKGTLYDEDLISKALIGKDACIHLALGWGDTPTEMLMADTKPAIYIFETAAKLGVKQIIYTSSCVAIGELRNKMDEKSNCLPADLYSANKAATEAYLNAISHLYQVKCNVIRPVYVFGNPVVKGAPMEPDARFRDIVSAAKGNRTMNFIKNDGTQFIWAGDLAKLYLSVLHSNVNRKVFLAGGGEYTTWETIGQFAIDYLNSNSTILLEDKGWAEGGCLYDFSFMKQEFGYKFEVIDKLKEHISYIASL